ncbi:MAG: hypothetical protein GX834_00825 [Clostridiaceae bacterium]|nr:hypothetical protein [Clostridiaceae bacterium]
MDVRYPSSIQRILSNLLMLNSEGQDKVAAYTADFKESGKYDRNKKSLTHLLRKSEHTKWRHMMVMSWTMKRLERRFLLEMNSRRGRRRSNE